MRSIAANALTLFVVIGLALAGAILWGKQQVDAPGPLAEERVFEVPRGASLGRVATLLEEQGVVKSATLFRLAARYRDQEQGLRYGEYLAPAGVSIGAMLDILTSGRTIQRQITIPEGLTSWEVVELLRGSELLTGDIEEVPPEGTLAPDTYAVQRGDTRAEVVARLQALQRQRVEQAWAERIEDGVLGSPEELVTLASIIEKETAVAEERGRVSGVFHNRLRRGMRLQSDPTIIYGITDGRGRLDRALTRTDIQTPTDWNTYTIDALPPTPIGNPGFASLLAAAKPEETDALYFVADGTGGHAFARTLEEHNSNVARWRAIERARQ